MGAPATRAARRAPSKTRRLNQLFELLCQRGLVARFETGGETNVMQQSFVVIQPKQHRANQFSFRSVTESADDTVGRAQTLHLDHAVTIATLIRQVEALGNYSIDITSSAGEPAFCDLKFPGLGRQFDRYAFGKIFLCERVQFLSSV